MSKNMDAQVRDALSLYFVGKRVALVYDPFNYGKPRTGTVVGVQVDLMGSKSETPKIVLDVELYTPKKRFLRKEAWPVEFCEVDEGE